MARTYPDSPSTRRLRGAARDAAPTGQRPLRLFLLPHAGGSASVYRGWSAALGSAFGGSVEAVAVELPGHGSRAREPLRRELHDVVADLEDRWPAAPGDRWAILGHSLGAMIAAEWAAETHGEGRGPQLVVVSAAAPPWLHSTAADLHTLDDEEFWRRVADLGALSGEVARRPGVRRTHGPILRADLALALAHRPARPKPVGCPIVAVVGAHDPLTRTDAVAGWAQAAAGGFESHVLAGGHFYRTGVDDILPVVTRSLTALVKPPTPSRRARSGGFRIRPPATEPGFPDHGASPCGRDGGGTNPPEQELNYSSYLALDDVLGAQRPRSTAHDEMLFIVAHQVYELWFKLLIHELPALQDALAAGRTPESLSILGRVLAVLRTVVGQFDVLETMTARQFASFRDLLGSSSGAQSAQFREIEAVLGRRDAASMLRFPPDSAEHARIARRMAQPSLFDSFLRYLELQGYQIPAAVLRRDVSASAQPSAAVREVLSAAYRDGGGPAQIAERLLDVDERVQEWRYRHLKLVERVIGHKPGTGGSSGAAFLRTAVPIPAFADLWATRSEP